MTASHRDEPQATCPSWIRERALSRRRFFGLTAAVAATAGVVPATSALSSGPMPKYQTIGQDKLGVALWTCEGQYAVSMPATLEAVAAVGYRYVQTPTLFGYGSVPQAPDAKAFRKALDDSGLWCVGMSGPSPYPYDDKVWKSFVQDNLVVGTSYLGGNLNLPSTTAECGKYVAAVHKASSVARRMGFKGALFNHLEKASWVRLKEDPKRFSLEYILKRTTPDVWQPELDTGHALWHLGSVANVAAFVRKYPGRFPLLHMKDGFAPGVPTDAVNAVPLLFNPTPFGAGDFGRPDPTDPQMRPHAGFQDLLAAVRETTDWRSVLLMAEQDGSGCADYIVPFYQRMKGLKFAYR